jgi:hypothetical protein
MIRRSTVRAFLLNLLILAPLVVYAVGITPEQIYQPVIDEKDLYGTWEVLSEQNPLDEKPKTNSRASDRMLMTLRKDGTCRIFNKQYPLGSDGQWTLEDHQMVIAFPNGSRTDIYIYGIKRDFMVTLYPAKNGKDLLWARVK